MPENKSRFVALCQQFLALGTVVAMTVPAAGMLTLDIVAPTPGDATADTRHVEGSLVASEPVAPAVEEVPITGVDRSALRDLNRHQGDSMRVAGKSNLAALTRPEPVSGYATIGVTWKPGVKLSDEDITVSVRSLRNGAWSAWQDVPYDSDHGPDPDSAEGAKARQGTDAVVVGDVSDVQVKAVTASGEAPPDMQLAVINPGETTAPKMQQPAIDTARLTSAEIIADAPGTATDEPTAFADPALEPTPAAGPAAPLEPGTEDPVVDPADEPGDGAALAGTPAEVTPKPQIYSRAQWGADERMRDKSSLQYYEVHAGFVHHTVNANGYTRAQVPSILRGIYAYHTQTKGWSDIGYNFLVDRFGRIWEGRYGGVDLPVVGAHTLGYNERSFAMSAIGNYETARPSAAMLDAYGQLFAWKLSLHGVDASSTKQWVGKKNFQAINGHRDAGQTACPGRYLYARLPDIRALAAKYQKPFTSRAKSTNISGSRWPDLIVRDKDTRQAYVVRTGGQVRFDAPRIASGSWASMDLITATRDMTGDGVPDMMARNATTKVTSVFPGDGLGGFGAAVTSNRRFANSDQLTAVGDLNRDGRNDVVARDATTKRLYLYRGKPGGHLTRPRLLSADWSGYELTSGVGDFTGDGIPDLVARDTGNVLWLVPGAARARLGTPTALSPKWGKFDIIAGMGDATNDGQPDIIARVARTKVTYIYPGDGAGGLGTRYGPYTTFKGVTFLANAGQVTGSRSADLVGRDARTGRMVVFGNTGGRNVVTIAATNKRFAAANLLLNVGDWNGDGFGDVMTRSARTGGMTLYTGNGKDQFADGVRAAADWGSVDLLAAVGDITGDGFPDLMGQPRGSSMRIYPGNGATGFKPSYVAHSRITAGAQIGVGLWNSDGSPDTLLRRADGALLMYPGNGPGGLTSGSAVATGTSSYDWMQGTGDADGDGNPDVIARSRASGQLWLLPGNGRGGFDGRRYIGSGFERFDLGD